MRIVPRSARITIAAVVLVALSSQLSAAQTLAGRPAEEAPTAAILGTAGDNGDTVRITHTADGQLLVRIYGDQTAMLILEESAGRAFAASLRDYVDRAATSCVADATEGIPRLTAARVHRSGIDGIAVRCTPAANGGGPVFELLVTRRSRDDGPPLQALTVQATSAGVKKFARDIETIMTARRR